MPDRHRNRLPEKTFEVAPGDLIGGLIYVMDKPLGIEEGMVGISMDSEPYREFVADMIQAMEYKLSPTVPEDLELKSRANMIPSDHPVFKGYQKFKDTHPELFSTPHNIDNIIDGLLKDKTQKKARHPLRARDIKKFFSFRKLHEIKAFQSYYKNTGMGGLLFQYYKQTCQIKPNDHFATQIGKLINHGNKAYMVKQDGKMQLGGTAPGAKKVLKTGIGKKWLQPLLHPVVIVATAGLSVPLFGIGMGVFRGFYITRNRPANANSDAIVEALSTKIAGIKGFYAQEIDTIEGTYANGTPKIATVVTWAKGCRDLSGKIAGGGKTWDNVVAMWDKENGLPVKIDHEGNLIEVKEKDDKDRPISYQKILPDGTITTASKTEYDQAKMISEDKILGLGESLLSFISMGDRDGIGGMGQNKAYIPLGNGLYQFYGIDFGKAYNGDNPIVGSLRDDFSFENPAGAQQRFRNISILYDTPLRDKMKGVYLLAALRGQMDPDTKARIVQEYRELGDDTFAEKLTNYPDSVGGVNADLVLIQSEIQKYQTLEQNTPVGTAKDQYGTYVRRLQDVLRIATSSDETILATFDKRKNLTPKQIDLLDNVEKLTAKKAYTTSPDGKVILNHIRVENVDRVPWQITPGQNGNFTLTCEGESSENNQVLQQLTKINGFPPMQVSNGKLTLEVTPAIFQMLQANLTEQKVAEIRGLHYRTPEERKRVFELLTAKRKTDINGEQRVKVKVQPEEPTSSMTIHSPTPAVLDMSAPVAQPVERASTRARPIGFAFNSTSAPIVTEPSFKQTQTNVAALYNYLTPENKTKHHVLEAKDKHIKSGVHAVEITFENPDTKAKPKAFAENGSTQDSISFSTTVGLPQDDFKFIAKEIAAMAMALAKPGAEFDLTNAPEAKREILVEAFTQAIEEAIKDNRFKEDTKPTIKTEVSTTSPRPSPST